jgi:NDP-sugar pyrophosphorylase family protein
LKFYQTKINIQPNLKQNSILTMSIHALILCGGKGERLLPHTYNKPKPLVKIKDKSILGYIIEHISVPEIDKITVATGYMSEKISKYIEKNYADQNISVSDQGDVDILTRIISVLPMIKTDFILLYGDTISDVDLADLIKFAKTRNESVSVTLWPLKSQFGVLETDENNKVISYAEKPILNKWINIGYIYIKKKSFPLIKESNTFEGFLNNLIDHSELAGFKHKGHHITVNTLKELKDAEAHILNINNIIK